MLSPHEFATLMLVKDATSPLQVDHADLNALLERQLVSVEQSASGYVLLRLTHLGQAFLKFAARIRADEPYQTQSA
ncbi:hypothetical protein [Paraburkholderia sp.]|jgi:hypothetical protein|uniref:hypothetical protein n=1 Tax=Paraburkholderia sp. TaxID=1926495 RepID=UPI002F40A1F6